MLELGLEEGVSPAGLVYVPGFLDEADEAGLVRWLDAQPWRADLARRVQHYGWRYDYRGRRIDAGQRLGALPAPLERLAGQLVGEGWTRERPDQAIVNEYLPGQGIAAHVDCEPCFGEEIATVSLLDDAPMDFRRLESSETYERWLARRSVCVLSGESRHLWTHGIAKRRSDALGGGRRERGRRISVTFRKVIV